MHQQEVLPIAAKMDKVGYHSVECWGGATFDASLRFLKEDPWERLRKLRAEFDRIRAHLLNLLCHIRPVFQRIGIAKRIRQRYLRMAFFAVACRNCRLEIAQVISSN